MAAGARLLTAGYDGCGYLLRVDLLRRQQLPASHPEMDEDAGGGVAAAAYVAFDGVPCRPRWATHGEVEVCGLLLVCEESYLRALSARCFMPLVHSGSPPPEPARAVQSQSRLNNASLMWLQQLICRWRVHVPRGVWDVQLQQPRPAHWATCACRR